MALRKLFRLSTRRLLFLALTPMLAGEAAASEQPQIRWYAVHGAVADRNQSLNLGDGSHSLLLKGGWSCTVGSTSKQMPAYEARTTTCRKGAETFEFSVQCEPRRPKDHAQIRFRHVTGTVNDFIEVGCELANSAD